MPTRLQTRHTMLLNKYVPGAELSILKEHLQIPGNFGEGRLGLELNCSLSKCPISDSRISHFPILSVANLILQTLTEKYEHLIEDYRRLKSDYEEVREAREKYKKLAKDQDKNPFVLMLVDGDGYNVSDQNPSCHAYLLWLAVSVRRFQSLHFAS